MADKNDLEVLKKLQQSLWGDKAKQAEADVQNTMAQMQGYPNAGAAYLMQNLNSGVSMGLSDRAGGPEYSPPFNGAEYVGGAAKLAGAMLGPGKVFEAGRGAVQTLPAVERLFANSPRLLNTLGAVAESGAMGATESAVSGKGNPGTAAATQALFGGALAGGLNGADYLVKSRLQKLLAPKGVANVQDIFDPPSFAEDPGINQKLVDFLSANGVEAIPEVARAGNPMVSYIVGKAKQVSAAVPSLSAQARRIEDQQKAMATRIVNQLQPEAMVSPNVEVGQTIKGALGDWVESLKKEASGKYDQIFGQEALGKAPVNGEELANKLEAILIKEGFEKANPGGSIGAAKTFIQKMRDHYRKEVPAPAATVSGEQRVPDIIPSEGAGVVQRDALGVPMRSATGQSLEKKSVPPSSQAGIKGEQKTGGAELLQTIGQNPTRRLQDFTPPDPAEASFPNVPGTSPVQSIGRADMEPSTVTFGRIPGTAPVGESRDPLTMMPNSKHITYYDVWNTMRDWFPGAKKKAWDKEDEVAAKLYFAAKEFMRENASSYSPTAGTALLVADGAWSTMKKALDSDIGKVLTKTNPEKVVDALTKDISTIRATREFLGDKGDQLVERLAQRKLSTWLFQEAIDSKGRNQPIDFRKLNSIIHNAGGPDGGINGEYLKELFRGHDDVRQALGELEGTLAVFDSPLKGYKRGTTNPMAQGPEQVSAVTAVSDVGRIFKLLTNFAMGKELAKAITAPPASNPLFGAALPALNQSGNTAGLVNLLRRGAAATGTGSSIFSSQQGQ